MGKWRKQMASAGKLARKNNLEGGDYPALYLEGINLKETRKGNEYVVVNFSVLESHDLSQTVWNAERGAEATVEIHAHKAGQSAEVVFFVDMFEAALSGFKSLLSEVVGKDLFSVGEAELMKEIDNAISAENPHLGTVLSCSAKPQYTKGNGKLITTYDFTRLPEEYQKNSDKLLKEAKQSRRAA